MEATTAEQNLAKLDEVLDEYDRGFSLITKLNPKTPEYLSFTVEDLSKLSAEQCGEISATLALYSFHLQKEQNRQSSRVRWCESIIDITVAKELEQYKTQYQTFEERKILAINGNSYTKKLNELRIRASSRLTEIFGLSTKIDLYIKTLLELQQSKRRAQ